MLAVPGPLIAYTSLKFGSRSTAFTGLILSASGMLISSYATSVLYLKFSFGVLAGLGVGVVYQVSLSVVTRSFEKYQSLAMGVASCGALAGCMMYPPLLTYLIGKMGVWNVFRVLAGIAAFCALLLFTYPSERQKGLKTSLGGCLTADLSMIRSASFVLMTICIVLANFAYFIPIQHFVSDP